MAWGIAVSIGLAVVNLCIGEYKDNIREDAEKAQLKKQDIKEENAAQRAKANSLQNIRKAGLQAGNVIGEANKAAIANAAVKAQGTVEHKEPRSEHPRGNALA